MISTLKLLVLFLICSIYPSTNVVSQKLSSIEREYDYIEVWGLAKTQLTKEEFLKKLKAHPEGICNQSLAKMGFTNGNKIPIPFSNKIIITLRDQPKILLDSSMENLNKGAIVKWKELQKKINTLGHYERQQVAYLIKSYFLDHKEEFDYKFLKLKEEFLDYGIHLSRKKTIESMEVYKNSINVFSKTEILSNLYKSTVQDSIKEAAIFIAPNYLKTNEDLLDFLPLLNSENSGIQSVISSFIKNYKGQIDWDQHKDLLVNLLNNPNPFQCILALKVADKTGFSEKNMRQLLKTELTTIKDILKSDYFPEEEGNYLVAFMNKYSSAPIETNKINLLKRLQ